MLSTLASDTAGNHLRFPLEFSFSTVQSSSTQNGIISYPSHGDVDVDLICLQWDTDYFPAQYGSRFHGKCNPCFSRFRYYVPLASEESAYLIYRGSFHADTEYSITIDETAEDLDGIKLGNPFSFSFKTAPVSISSTSPRNGELFVSPSRSDLSVFQYLYAEIYSSECIQHQSRPFPAH